MAQMAGAQGSPLALEPLEFSLFYLLLFNPLDYTG